MHRSILIGVMDDEHRALKYVCVCDRTHARETVESERLYGDE